MAMLVNLLFMFIVDVNDSKQEDPTKQTGFPVSVKPAISVYNTQPSRLRYHGQDGTPSTTGTQSAFLWLWYTVYSVLLPPYSITGSTADPQPELHYSTDSHENGWHIEYCWNLQSPVDADEKDSCKDDVYEDEEALRGLHPMRPYETDITAYVVPLYQANPNPQLPLSLQQQVDRMSPREFCNHVFNELSLEQREALMCDEAQRRKTYLVNWPHSNHSTLSGIKMAQAGLYSLGDYDQVQCAFCRGRLHRWEPGDVPMVEHARMFNFCKFVKGLQCGNIEYKSKNLTADDLQHVTRFSTGEGESTSRRGADGGALGISTNRAATIRYAPRGARMGTYGRWPINSPVLPDQLCDAGFYYTGFDDQVRCFFCAGGLREWAEGDDPWEEHARWFPTCIYLLDAKGQEYINEVRERTPASKKCEETTLETERRTVVRQQQFQSTQEVMKSCVLNLGHTSEAIDRVIAINGGPFNDVKDMIEALYSLEDRMDEADYNTVSMQVQDAGEPALDTVSLPETQRSRLAEQEQYTTQSELSSSETRNCKLCEMRRNRIIPATHVALPCGHLIYCDSCNSEEAEKCATPNYTAKCLFSQCGAPVNGTIKIYLA